MNEYRRPTIVSCRFVAGRVVDVDVEAKRLSSDYIISTREPSGSCIPGLTRPDDSEEVCLVSPSPPSSFFLASCSKP